MLASLKVRLHVVVKTVFACVNISIFVDIYLPKSEPIPLGIWYRPPNKSDFVKPINVVLTETGILHKQECYLLGDWSIYSLKGKKFSAANVIELLSKSCRL